MNDGRGVDIDTNRVIDKLARRIAELEITVAQQVAIIYALTEDNTEPEKSDE